MTFPSRTTSSVEAVLRLRGVITVRHQATDPDGRTVVIDSRALSHLARRRPRMAAHIVAILDAIERPDLREDDPAPGRERFYRRDLDPDRWLRVVVDFNDDRRLS